MAIEYQPPQADRLWEAFEQWVKQDSKNLVELHDTYMQLWRAFRAGGDAEHQRIVGAFSKASLSIDLDAVDKYAEPKNAGGIFQQDRTGHVGASLGSVNGSEMRGVPAVQSVQVAKDAPSGTWEATDPDNRRSAGGEGR